MTVTFTTNLMTKSYHKMLRYLRDILKQLIVYKKLFINKMPTNEIISVNSLMTYHKIS